MMNLLLLLFVLTFASAAYYEELYKEMKKLYNVENNRQSTWEFGFNDYFRGKSEAQMKALLGVKKSDIQRRLKVKTVTVTRKLPEDFDARRYWPNCTSMRLIRDQAACGSCWAVSTTSAMSDRHCIWSNYTWQPYLSDEYMMTCCNECGFGCLGGYPERAWSFWTRVGVPTGGPYGSKSGCQPYMVSPKAPPAHTPLCNQTCIPEYNGTLEGSKFYGSDAYLVGQDQEQIMEEIIKNGPASGEMAVYTDFFYYKSGIYQHKSEHLQGYHAVKMMGWGVDNDTGTPYWLVANSWNISWGDKGMFKILRGSQECEIESGVMGGHPKPKARQPQQTKYARPSHQAKM